jgi:antitoxin HicB
MTTTAESQKTMNQFSGKHLEREAQGSELEDYLEKDYPIELTKDEGAYVASHPDLPGCVSFGDDPNIAVKNLTAIKRLWIEGQISSGNPIPEPSADGEYSGKFVLRIPKGLHRMAEVKARHEGVSLNSYVSNVLAGALGFARSDQRQSVSTLAQNLSLHWYDIQTNCDVPSRMLTLWQHGRATRQNEETSKTFISSMARRIGGRHKSKYVPARSDDEYFSPYKEHVAIK